MTDLPRRRWLQGAGALAVAPSLISNPALAAEPAMYDYIFLDLNHDPGVPPTRAYLQQVRERAPAIQAAGGDILGLFTPQIGWFARQAALLVRWSGDAKGRAGHVSALSTGKNVKAAQRGRLTATLRPAPTDKIQPGGIYVHRWFIVKSADVPQFLELSGTGWADFEVKFDTKIFGLFTADRTPNDVSSGTVRLLLLTRYKDHGVWETSRDTSTAAMAAFAKRQAITRDTWNASSLFVPV